MDPTVDLVYPKATGASPPTSTVEWLKHLFPLPVPLLAVASIPAATLLHLKLFKSLCIDDTPYKVYNSLRTRIKCDGCNGFEHEICGTCNSRGLLPTHNEYTRAMWTDHYQYRKGEEGPWANFDRGQEISYAMGNLSQVFSGMPSALPCRTCSGEGVVTCSQCKGKSTVLDPFPHLEMIAELPSRFNKVWKKLTPHGPALPPSFWETLKDKTAAQFFLQERPVLADEIELTAEQSKTIKDTWKRWKTLEDRKSNVLHKGPNWQQDLAALKQDAPVWVHSNSLALDEEFLKADKNFSQDMLARTQALEEGPEANEAPLRLAWAKQIKRAKLKDLFPEVDAEREWLEAERRQLQVEAWKRFAQHLEDRNGYTDDGPLDRSQWEDHFNRCWMQGRNSTDLLKANFGDEIWRRRDTLDSRQQEYSEFLNPGAYSAFENLHKEADAVLADKDQWQALASVPRHFEDLNNERRGLQFERLLAKDPRIQRTQLQLEQARATGRRLEVKRLEAELGSLVSEVTGVENALEAERIAKRQLQNVEAFAKIEAEEARKAKFAEAVRSRSSAWLISRIRFHPNLLTEKWQAESQNNKYEALKAAQDLGLLDEDSREQLEAMEKRNRHVGSKWVSILERPSPEVGSLVVPEVQRRSEWCEKEGKEARRKAGKILQGPAVAKGKMHLRNQEMKLEARERTELGGRVMGLARGIAFAPVTIFSTIASPIKRILADREYKKKQDEYFAERAREEEERLRSELAAPAATPRKKKEAQSATPRSKPKA